MSHASREKTEADRYARNKPLSTHLVRVTLLPGTLAYLHRTISQVLPVLLPQGLEHIHPAATWPTTFMTITREDLSCYTASGSLQQGARRSNVRAVQAVGMAARFASLYAGLAAWLCFRNQRNSPVEEAHEAVALGLLIPLLSDDPRPSEGSVLTERPSQMLVVNLVS